MTPWCPGPDEEMTLWCPGPDEEMTPWCPGRRKDDPVVPGAG